MLHTAGHTIGQIGISVAADLIAISIFMAISTGFLITLLITYWFVKTERRTQ